MTCHQVRHLIEEATLDPLRDRRYPDVQTHLQTCEPCHRLWQQRHHQEQRLRHLFTTATAPNDLWPHVKALISRYETELETPPLWQTIRLEVSPRGIQRLVLPLPGTAADALPEPVHQSRATALLIERARTQLDEYFRGERAIFRLPLDIQPGGAFQQAVLAAAATIPYGEVRSYAWIARQIGRPNAARAVGNALRHNPVPILVPCHRVVKGDGSIGGYAFGSAWKHRLLDLEGDTSPFVGCGTTRILCYRGCHHERRVREHNRIHFATVEDAMESGYRTCTVCQPTPGRSVSS